MLAMLLAMAPALALDYRVTYRGVFSLGQDMPIADVTIAEQTVAGGMLRELQLEASSAAYPVVESLYPVRYRVSSWVDNDAGLIALETYERTDRTKHRLYLRDDSVQGMSRIDRFAAEGERHVELLRSGRVNFSPEAPLFDRLGLLAQLRAHGPAVGQRISLPVTNGRERMRYDIVAESAATVVVDGKRVAATKFRLDAWEVDARGDDTPAHRPAYIWLGDDPKRTPLKIEVRHPIGLFRVELMGADKDIVVAAMQGRALSQAP